VKALAVCGSAFLLVCIAFAIHPAAGIVVGMFSIGVVDSLLSK
jgi:hypothetical protein